MFTKLNFGLHGSFPCIFIIDRKLCLADECSTDSAISFLCSWVFKRRVSATFILFLWVYSLMLWQYFSLNKFFNLVPLILDIFSSVPWFTFVSKWSSKNLATSSNSLSSSFSFLYFFYFSSVNYYTYPFIFLCFKEKFSGRSPS